MKQTMKTDPEVKIGIVSVVCVILFGGWALIEGLISLDFKLLALSAWSFASLWVIHSAYRSIKISQEIEERAERRRAEASEILEEAKRIATESYERCYQKA